jgi:heme/copper-type cytochrome/quinol oxidase subunit 2
MARIRMAFSALFLFAAAGIAGAASAAPCVPDATTLCLGSGRFQVRADWQALDAGTSGQGQASPLTAESGSFWFFDSSNVELIVKVLDGRAINGRFWLFYGALSNVQYTITATDTQTGAVRTYFNPQGTLASAADTSAFSDAPAGSQTVTIDVSQWNYNPGGPVSGPLVLTVGVDYTLVFHSIDVQHGFSGISDLGIPGTDDISPGTEFSVRFTPRAYQRGSYFFQCTHVCGDFDSHLGMTGILRVQ